MTDAQETNRQREILKYRWEFTRRDPAYRKMYNNMTALWDLMQMGCRTLEINAMQHDPADDFSSKRQLFQSSADKLIELGKDLNLKFEAKFGFPFFLPLHPDKCFEEIEPHLMMDNLKLFVKKLKEAGSSVDYNISDDLKLNITIDLQKINSRDILLKEIKAIIKAMKDDIDTLIGKNGTLKKKDFNKILEIGDLYEKLGSQKKVARQTYKRDRSGQDSARIKVSQHLKDYRFFIHGGYRFLTYP